MALPSAVLATAFLSCSSALTIPSSNGRVLFSNGRFDFSNRAAPRFDYPGGSASISFTGSTRVAMMVNASAVDSPPLNYPGTPRQEECHASGSKVAIFKKKTDGPTFAVSLNGEFTSYVDVESCEITDDNFLVPRRNNSIVVASGLDPRKSYTISVMKNFEVDVATFHGFELDASAKLLDKPTRPKRRLLCIGDSITCGYGVGDGNCHPNHYRTWCQVAGRMLGAESQAVCKSGAGIYFHDNEYRDDLLVKQSVWQDVNASYDLQDYVPDVVVLNIGSNDKGASKRDRAGWESNYTSMLHGLRAAYPKAPLLLGQGPFNGGVSHLDQFVAAYNDTDGNAHYVDFWPEGCTDYRHCGGDPPNGTGPVADPTGYGCHGHPGWGTQQQMAEIVAEKIQSLLPWNAAHIVV